MDLRQLRYVTELAQSGSFVRAAEELHITQSALTRSIQSIEAELGVRLFERGPQGAQLTQEGKMLVDVAGQIRLMLGGLRHDIGLSKKGHLGEVAFGLGPSVASIFLSDVLSELINGYPQLQIRSYVNNADQLREALLTEHIEFFVNSAGQFPDDPRITSSLLGPHPLSLFVRAGHPLANRKKVPLKDLAAFPLMTGNVSQLFQPMTSLLPAPPPPLKFNVGCDDYSILKDVVQRTDAIWQTSHAVVAEEYRRKKIVELDTARKSMRYSTTLVIVALAGRKLSPAAELVVQIIRKLYDRILSKV